MECPKCGYEWKLPGQQKGGSAKVKKGLACRPDVQARIQAKRKAERQIRQNIWGNWYGYEGAKRVASFAETPQYTAEQNAQRWLNANTDN